MAPVSNGLGNTLTLLASLTGSLSSAATWQSPKRRQTLGHQLCPSRGQQLSTATEYTSRLIRSLLLTHLQCPLTRPRQPSLCLKSTHSAHRLHQPFSNLFKPPKSIFTLSSIEPQPLYLRGNEHPSNRTVSTSCYGTHKPTTHICASFSTLLGVK